MSDEDERIMQALQHLDDATTLLRAVVGARAVNGRSVIPIDENFLDQSVHALDFGHYSTRLHHMFATGVMILTGAGTPSYRKIRTVRDILTVTESECLRAPNVGRNSVNRLKIVLAAHGLRLGMRADDDRTP